MSNRATQDYRPEPPPGTTADRARVEIVPGSESVYADDLYPLLLRRLRAVVTIAVVLHLITVAQSLSLISHDLGQLLAGGSVTANEKPISTSGLILRMSFLVRGVIFLGVAALLWTRPPTTVRGLRLVEFVALGLYAGRALFDITLPERWDTVARLADVPQEWRWDVERAYIVSEAFEWFGIIIVYGTVFPNTWRRCAAVVTLLALCPLGLLAVYGLWVRPVDHAVLATHLTDLAISNGLAVAIVVFAASRVEVLRRQAAEARKLGQYILREKLGAGGMGEVYRAEHVLLRRPCAIKLIRPERAGDPRNLRRFEREVQVTATLTHPNTIQVYDYGRADDGTFYYVMEYLPGKNLEQLVKEVGPLPPERVVHLLRQVCGALREAHAAGLIHRDIKPSNIIVGNRGGLPDVAKLLDFGIVDVPTTEPGEAFTALGHLLGTPAYMSAEQAAGMADVDARSDLYSLGATAYFLLTGKAPFERATINLTIAAHIHDVATPPHYLRTEIPADLSAVVLRCLEKEPAKRYPDAAALEAALAECKCAGRWTGERAAQAGSELPKNEEGQRIGTTELERRWGF